MKQANQVKKPDFKTSPLTGMMWQHYVDCARYIFERTFNLGAPLIHDDPNTSTVMWTATNSVEI